MCGCLAVELDCSRWLPTALGDPKLAALPNGGLFDEPGGLIV